MSCRFIYMYTRSTSETLFRFTVQCTWKLSRADAFDMPADQLMVCPQVLFRLDTSHAWNQGLDWRSVVHPLRLAVLVLTKDSCFLLPTGSTTLLWHFDWPPLGNELEFCTSMYVSLHQWNHTHLVGVETIWQWHRANPSLWHSRLECLNCVVGLQCNRSDG